MKLQKRIIEAVSTAIADVLAKTFGEVQARDLGLYIGMEHPSSDNQFWERLRKAPEEKRNLGRYLCRPDADDGIPSLTWNPDAAPDARKSLDTLFIESGSTICPLIGELANILANPIRAKAVVIPKEVLTNNMFALTALVNLVHEVTPVEGSFRTRYFGFFPFAESEEAPTFEATKRNKQLWHEELVAYSKLKSTIDRSNLVVATCSNFSFLAGPLVGQRANAITKHAMYLGKSRRNEFILMFHFTKIIPIDTEASSTEGPKDTCYCVLAVPEIADGLLKTTSLNSWHKRWTKKEHRNIATEFGKGAIKMATHASLEVPVSDADFQKSWFDCREGVRIIISLPEQSLTKACDFLRKEVAKANAIAKNFGLEYVLCASEELVNKHRVVEIEMKSNSSR